jgi:hypothetical protein
MLLWWSKSRTSSYGKWETLSFRIRETYWPWGYCLPATVQLHSLLFIYVQTILQYCNVEKIFFLNTYGSGKNSCLVPTAQSSYISKFLLVHESAEFKNINSLKSWFIFNLQKININQYCESTRGNGIIMIPAGDILQELIATSIILAKTYSYDFVHTWKAIFLEHLVNTSFKASIQAWTEPSDGSLSQVYSLFALAHPILLFAPTDQVSHSTPSLLTGWLLTNIQVNNMAALHDTCADTHIYITLTLLFFPFFILLPLLLAGRLA